MSDTGRIKANINKMIDGGATEAEIDGYLDIEGVTVDDLHVGLAPQQPQPGDEGYNENAEPFMGDMLPVSREEYGGPVSFNSDAGLLGSMKRAVQLPGQVMSGEVDPMSESGSMQTLEAALMVSPMSAVSRMGKLAPKSSFKAKKPVSPTREALQEATSAGYKEARDMGAEYTPQSISKWADDTLNALDAEGRIAENYPKVHALIEKVRNPPDGATSVTLESVDALYKRLGDLGADVNEGKVASLVQKGLDDFHATLDPSALVAGTTTPQRAAQVLKEARGNAAAGFRSDRVTGLEKTSERRTAAANSGRNADNNIRQRLTSLIESAKGSRGLTKAEEQAIDDIIFGSPTKNAARYIGNLMGAGGGLGQSAMTVLGAGGGAAMGGTPGAIAGAMIPPVIGSVARGTANHMTKKELKMLDALLRSRSPLAESMKKAPPIYQPGATQGAAETMIRALGAQPAAQRINPKVRDYGWI